MANAAGEAVFHHNWTDVQYSNRGALLRRAKLTTMNAPLLPDVFAGAVDTSQPQLPLASEGVQRYVWQGAFGQMLIEVHDGAAFVNGVRVEPIAETLRKADSDSEPPPR